MYNDEKNLYHYTYRKDGSENAQQEGDWRRSSAEDSYYQPNQNSWQQPPEPPKKKSRAGLKMAALALACALLGGAVIVFTMAGLQRFDNWMKKHSRYIDLYVECSTKGSFGEFIQYARENGIEISDIQASQEETFHKEKGKQRTASYIFTATSEKKITHADMIEILSNARGIQYLEEL